MKRRKLARKIPEVLFAGGFLLLLFLWLGSFLNFEVGPQYLGFSSEFEGTKAFASVNDVKEAFTDSFLPNDTMWVVDDSASAGDTLWITVSIKNTIRIAGFTFALSYDTSILAPEWRYDIQGDPPETVGWNILTQKTPRTEPLIWYYWMGGIWNKHLDTLKFAAVAILAPTLPKGKGPVVKIKFKVKPTAIAGDTCSIFFCPGLPGVDKPNTFVDSLGIYDFFPRTRKGIFTVKGGVIPGNNCPVFASSVPADSYQVNEGTTLQFDVRATDADGDTITLSLASFSPPPPGANYHFATKTSVGTVTQTFDYTPDFDEAPITRTAIFKAIDHPGCQVTKTVTIRVIDTPQDRLIAGDDEGGVPGSTGILVPFILTSSVDIYGFQFTFRWDQAKLLVDSIVGTDVISGFSIYTNLGDSVGKATVLVFGLAGQTIPSGLDTVVYASFSVLPDAPMVEVPITLENAREAINPGYPSKALFMVDGKFTIDIFGDVNVDRLVDVADVVTLVAYILGDIPFTPRQMSASDINRDTFINVGDLVAMIDIILGRWMGPSPPMYPEPMADLRLDYKELELNSFGEVKVLADLKVPVAGAQLQINYDPDKVSFQAPRLSERSDHFIVEHRDDGKGKLTLVLYNFANQPIPTGVGNILSIPATVTPCGEEELKIELEEVVLSDEKAVVIPVEGEGPSMPNAFELSQNYPNPFNPTTTIKFTLPLPKDGGASLPASLRIYNVLGELVRTLVDEPLSAGIHHKVWDGKDDQGNPVASGIYFYRLRAGDFQDTKKMVLLK